MRVQSFETTLPFLSKAPPVAPDFIHDRFDVVFVFVGKRMRLLSVATAEIDGKILEGVEPVLEIAGDTVKRGTAPLRFFARRLSAKESCAHLCRLMIRLV